MFLFIELPNLIKAPTVLNIGPNSVQIKFSASHVTGHILSIIEYRIEYMMDDVGWTVYNTIKPVRGHQSFTSVVDSIEVG